MLIDCAHYVNGVRQAALEFEAISDVLQAQPAAPGFIWVDLAEPDQDLLAKMQEEFGLHELAIEDTNRGGQRSKVEDYGATLFVAVESVRDAGRQLRSIELHCYVAERFLLTVLHSNGEDVRVLREVRAELEREPEFLGLGPGAALHGLLDRWVDRLFPELAKLQDRLDEIEERIFDDKIDNRTTIGELYELKRETMRFRRVLTPLLEMGERLLGIRHPIMSETLRPYFRDVHDHLLRIDAAVDTLRDLQNAATQTSLALITLGEGETTKKLAGWGAVLTVPMITGTIYGMNFEKMPELKWEYGYPLALAAMLATSVAVWAWFRKIRWL